MSEQQSPDGASTSGPSSVSNPESTLEINVKTLDSQIYKFHVENNMLVSSFKGKIADQVGVPVGQQRLIFRGKVLKDEHSISEYHVENGDTLHLVERQPAQPTPSGAAETSGNTGTQGNDGAPRPRFGQISHSVVLGTLNVGDQGEGVASDLTRVLGAVLNSFGVGNQSAGNATMAAQNAPLSNSSGSQGNGERQSTGGIGAAGQQPQSGHPFTNQPFFMPFGGASIPPPSLNMPIPDSFHTIMEFITRMEEALSRNGYQSTPLSTGGTDQPMPQLPHNGGILPTPEALCIVLRSTQRLLSGLAIASLSHIAGRLEQEGGSTDISVRSQIQADSVQVGLAMQHLGALLLELGRTILMLRMGQSPAEAAVNAGHAVYISPSGPNLIMVQPFPHQTSPLFNASTASPPNTGSMGPVGIIGSAPRNINIHIHAGTSIAPMVSAVGARPAGADGAQGERGSGTASGDSGAARVFPVRNIIAAAPTGGATLAVSHGPNASQPLGGISSQPTDVASLSATISEVNARIRNLLGNINSENQSSGSQENSSVSNASSETQIEASGEASESHVASVSGLQASQDETARRESSLPNVLKFSDGSTGTSGVSLDNSGGSSKGGQNSGNAADDSSGSGDVPLGLGGGLQPKRRAHQSKPQLKDCEGSASASYDQSHQARAAGLQVLQSLASQGSAGRTGSTEAVTRQDFGPAAGDSVSGTRSSTGQLDVTRRMSQLLETPALDGFLSGIAQQAGIGSPDVMRNMVQQVTQNPMLRNTLNQLAQQVDGEEIRNMFGGTGSNQGGGLDLSRMIQQMMPMVSQVLGGGSFQSEPVLNTRLNGGGNPSPQSGTQDVAQRIAQHSLSEDIFGALVQNAAEHAGMDDAGILLNGLANNESLTVEFMDILRNDLQRQL